MAPSGMEGPTYGMRLVHAMATRLSGDTVFMTQAPAVTHTPAIPAPAPLPRPEGLGFGRVVWPYVLGFSLYHALALLAVLPWLFSWAGLTTALCGLYVFGTLGVNLCYHRLLTHRSFTCPKWLEHLLSILGVCCLQDTPVRWVAVHRMHHQHSDEPADPHSPLVNFFWGHMGWLLVPNRALARLTLYERYSKDLLRDALYKRLERDALWVWINLAQWF